MSLFITFEGKLRIYHETASVRDCYAVKLFVFKSYRYE